MRKLLAGAACLCSAIAVAAFMAPGPRPAAATAKASSLPGYDLSKPIRSFSLPAELNEISGLTDVDDDTIACVQDELGMVFYVDLRSGSVSKTTLFGGRGDYEGLTRVADKLWVLRSDGVLFELVPRDEGGSRASRLIALDIEHREVEGLAFDPFREVLIVAPKGSPSGRRRAKGERRLFSVDPATGEQMGSPVLSTSVERIVADARLAGVELPVRTTKKGKRKAPLKARFSAVAVHPLTDELYLASGSDGALLVFGRDSRLRAAHFFDDHSQIEGITFATNGDLIISSEKSDSPPAIRIFRYEGGTDRSLGG